MRAGTYLAMSFALLVGGCAISAQEGEEGLDEASLTDAEADLAAAAESDTAAVKKEPTTPIKKGPADPPIKKDPGGSTPPIKKGPSDPPIKKEPITPVKKAP